MRGKKRPPRGRGSVIGLDRADKAAMIHAIVADHRGAELEGIDLLDIGTGNGEISEWFARHNRVATVDVSDRRRAPGDAEFHLVDSETLPFDDASFDVVVSHHVIEHVADQRAHLTEMRRVVRPDGCVYLATPNRSSPIMEGHVGNESVLRWPEMAPLFASAGFEVHEYGWRVVCEPDRFHGEQRFGRFLPSPVARMLRRFYPSHMFVLDPVNG